MCLLVIALMIAVANPALALRLTNETTGELLFFEDGFENDTFPFNPDAPEEGQWDSFDQSSSIVTSVVLNPDPGPLLGDQYFVKGAAEHPDPNRSATVSWPGKTASPGDRLHLEFIHYLPSSNSVNSFAFAIQLRDSAGNSVVGFGHGRDPFRPSGTSTTGLHISKSVTGSVTGIVDVPDVWRADTWQKFDVFHTVAAGLADTNTFDVTVTNNHGTFGPFTFNAGTSTGVITNLVLIDDDRPDIWFLDWDENFIPEPGTVSLLGLGGIMLLFGSSRSALRCRAKDK